MLTVLLVEDDGPLRACMTDILEDEGYAVVAAPHGQAALALLETVQPAVIVTDVMMPVMDGLALCQQLRAQPTTAAIPIIVCSAGADRPNLHQYAVAAFLEKPFSLPTVLTTIAMIVQTQV